MAHRPAARPVLEELEPRILYSADIAAVAMAAAGASAPQLLRLQDEAAPLALSTAPNEIAFVDMAVPDAAALVSGLQAQRDAGRPIEIVRIEAGADGVALIGESLAQRSGVTAVHLLGHGSDAVVQLGSTRLDATSLLARAGEIAGWGSALSADADVLLYGCDVAAQADGLALIDALAALTGADVAASEDSTGAAARGGDWVLERSTGAIGTPVAADTALQQAWAGLLGNDHQVNTTTADKQTTDALTRGSTQTVAIDADGNYVVVWTSKGQDNGSNEGVYARRFAFDGTALTGEIPINQQTTGKQNQAHVVSDTAGNFVVVWSSEGQDGSQAGVYARRFAADGSALGNEFLVNTTTTGDQTNPAIAINRATGDFVVAWQGQGASDNNGVFARRFAANGTALDAAEIAVHTASLDAEANPAVAMDTSGRFVVAYDVLGHTYAQRFAATGAAAGGALQIDNAWGDNAGAAVAMADNGNFVVVYHENNIIPGIWGRGFTFAGGVYISAFNVSTVADATSPSIAMTGSGSFIVTWQASGSDGQEVFARKYAANGSTLATTFAVNQATSGNQQMPSVALHSIDRYVVAWSGQSSLDTEGVVARTFAPAPAAPSIVSNGGGATAAVTIDENTTAVTTVVATDADLPTATVTYGIAGGADAARFTIDAATGVLRFAAAPDFDVPADAGGDNVYDVKVQASDGVLASTQDIAVTVADSLTGDVLIAAQDTFIESGTNASLNHGQSTSLVLDKSGGSIGNSRVLLQFDLSAIPAGATITSAQLQMTSTQNGGALNLNVYRVTSPWIEGSGDATAGVANWTQRVAGTNWGSAGGDYAPTAVATFNSGSTGLHQWDLTALVTDWYQSNLSNDGVMLASPDTGGSTVTYDSAEGTNAPRLVVTFTMANVPPTITSDGGGGTAALNVPENSLTVTTVTASDADLPAQTLGYSLAGGADAASFTIDSVSGLLRFAAAPDREAPADANGDNVYEVVVRVADGAGGVDQQVLAVTVTGVNEAPPVVASNGGGASATITVNENTTAVTTVVATDADLPAQTISYAIDGGADAARFTIDAATGVLRFVAAPDAETPLDAGIDNVYDVIVAASDGTLQSTQALAVTVSDVDETLVVTTVADTMDGDVSSVAALLADRGADGAISLREAIRAANATAGRDEIHFAIAGAGVQTIALTSTLPVITDALVIDGSTQTGFDGTPLVQIDGAGAGTDSNGLVLGAGSSQSVVRGLVVSRFEHSNIAVGDGSGQHLIAGNYIGTTADGLAAAGTSLWGIDLFGGGTGIVIGGTTAADANVIGGNIGYGGIAITSTQQVTVTGNFIGVGADATTAVGNHIGIFLLGDTAGTQIGGTVANEANVIAANGSTGVVLSTGATASVLGNRIFGNAMAIDLGWDGVYATNDTLDADAGPNGLQNHPTLTTATLIGTDLHLAGTLYSAANAHYRIEFFGSAVADGAGHGDGRSVLGHVDVLTDSAGRADFNLHLATTSVVAGDVVAATATLSDAAGTLFGGTSELGLALAVAPNSAPVIGAPGGGAASATVTVAENTTAAAAPAATDPDTPAQTLVWSIAGGADAGRFTIDAGSGALAFTVAPDFETALDAGANNVYDIVVQVSDGIDTDTLALAVTVTNVVEAPVAVDDLMATTRDTAVTASLVANDRIDAAGTPRILDAVAAANGTLLVGTGAVTYTPTSGFVGSDQFQYLLDDGQSDLQHYWRLDGHAIDAIGSADGTLLGGPTRVAGHYADALYFDGVDDRVRLPDTAYGADFTLSFWFNMNGNAGTGYRYMVSHGDPSLQNSLNVYFIEASTVTGSGVKNVLRTSVMDGNDTTGQLADLDVSATGLADNTWHQYTLTVKAGVGSAVWIDGVQRATTANGADGVNPTGAITVGARFDLDAARFYTGRLDTLALHGHALAADEVAALYTGGTALGTVKVTVSAGAAPTAPVAVADRYTVVEDQSLAATVANGWFDAAWSTRHAIAIDNAGGPALTDQVILVTLDATTIDYATVQDAGQDLRFTDAAGNLLDHEIERWDESGVSRIWVRVPAVAAGSTGDAIWLYHGNAAAADAQDAAGVWGTNAAAVLHLGSTLADSSAAANPVTNGGAVVSSGAVADGRSFDGVDDFIDIGSAAAVDNLFAGGGTVSAWIRPTGWGEAGYGRIASKASSTYASGATGVGWNLELNGTNGSLLFEIGNGTTRAEWQTAAGSIRLNTWQQVTLTYDTGSNANNPAIYIDGVAVAVTRVVAPSGAVASDASLPLRIGNQALTTDRTFVGAIDEVRIYGVARTAAQVAADVRAAGGAMATVGAAQSALPGVINNDTASSGQPLVATLVSGPLHAASFTFNADGTFSYVPLADYSGSDSFRYTVSDGILSSAVATVAIDVAPVNDAPVITSGSGTAAAAVDVTEGSTAVATMAAGDVDQPAQMLTWSIAGGADAGRFVIDAATGVLRFTAAPDFEAPADADGNNVYELVVRVDDGALADTQTISVRVGDANESSVGAPVDTDAAANSVSELAVAGTVVGLHARAVDADGSNNGVTYALADSAAGRFAIDAASGVVTLAGTLDFETAASHTIIVVATSADGSSNSASFTIAVTDANEAAVTVPVDIDGEANAVAESAAVGTTVGVQAHAVDADGSNNGVTYTLADSAGGRFAIDAASGVVTLAGALDFEAAASHTITVVATSADGSSNAASFTVTVLDAIEFAVGPLADGDAAADTVAENATTGTVVGLTARAVDADVFDTVSYHLLDSAGGRFAIDAASGVVRVAGALDAETAASHTIIVQAQSTDGSVVSASFTIAVRDVDEFVVVGPADVDAAANRVREDAGVGAAVGLTAQASDADAGAGLMRYALDDAAGGRFSIDASTGTVTLARALSDSDIGSHTVVVRATSGDGDTATRSFTITVDAVNDHAPVIVSDGGGDAAALRIDEGTTAVTTVRATDADLPAQTLQYTIAGGADAGRFVIDAATGALRFVVAPDREAPVDADGDHRYEVVVRAGDGERADEQTLTVEVANVDEAPSFTDNRLVITEGGTAAPLLQATDADTPAAGLTFTVDGVVGGRFERLGAPGVAILTFTQADLDAGQVRFVADGGEQAPAYRVTVDDGRTHVGPQAEAVAFTPVNDAPVVRPVDLGRTVEDTPRTITLAEWLEGASDADGDTLAVTGVRLVAGNGTLASLVGGRWQFTPAADWHGAVAIDFEVGDGTTSVSNRAVLAVTAVNDAPRFTGEVGAGGAGFALSENSTAITTLAAADVDGDVALRFAIVGGADAALFRVDPVSGALAFRNAPDFERPADNRVDNRYDLVVQVTDGALSSQASLTVAVTAVDEAPVITANGLVVNGGTVTLALRANDPDTPTSALVYAVSSTAGGRFEATAQPGTPVTTFTQADVDAGRIRFVADGSRATPQYTLSLSDGQSSFAVGAPSVVRVVAPALAIEVPSAGAATAAEPAKAAPPAAAPAAAPAARPAAGSSTSAPGLGSALLDTPRATLELAAPAAAARGDAGAVSVPAVNALRAPALDAVQALWSELRLALPTADEGRAFAPVRSGLESLASSSGGEFAQALDRVRQQIAGGRAGEDLTVASTTLLSTGLSVGYVLWLARGGVLMASLISTVPAWAGIDPLPVLSQMRRDEDDDGEQDDDPIERLFSRARKLITRPSEVPADMTPERPSGAPDTNAAALAPTTDEAAR